MPQIPQGHDAAAKDPHPLLTKVLRGITGVYTAASRNAIPDDKAFNLENIIPVGPQNAVVTRGLTFAGVDFTSAGESIYYADSVNLNGTPYLVLFSITGNVYLYNTLLSQAQKINPTGLQLNGSGSRCDQWENSVILFVDHTGYYSYDGTTFQQITGPGVPLSGGDIAVYAGRVWIVFGRVLFASGAGDYTAASWLPQNGASFNIFIDPQIRSSIQRLKAASGVLYVFADSGINVIFNVQIPIGAVPPTPVYTNQNIQPLIGTDQPASVTPFDQSTLFTNKYGVYKMYGVNAPKISSDIDGTWQKIDFTFPISSGEVVVEGILCSAILFNRIGDSNFSSGPILAMWFPRDGENAWWFANFGQLSLIVSAIVNGQATLYGMIGKRLYQLFSSIGAPLTAIISTKLYPMEDDLQQKEAMRAGFLADIQTVGSAIDLTVDGLTDSVDTDITLSLASGLWTTSDGTVGQWKSNIPGLSLPVLGGWFSSGFSLSSGQAPSMFSHNLGLTLKATGYKLILNLMAIDYKLRDRWM